jgi:putative peptidoglycan lipid II flippase
MNRKMFKGMLQFAFGIGIAKGFLFLKDIILASKLGASSELDSFIYSFTLIMLVVNLLGNPFQLILTTALSRLDASARSALRQSLVSSTILLIAATSLIFSLCIFLWTQSASADIRSTVLILIPFAIFATLNIVNQSILESRNDFLISSIAQSSLPVVTILGILFIPTKHTLTLLAWSAVIGAFLEYAVLSIRARFHDIVLLPSIRKPPEQFIQTLKHSLVYIIGSFFLSFIDVIDQSMALPLGPGSVTAWSYGAKIPLFINLILAGALAKVFLPSLSHLLEAKDYKQAQTLVLRIISFALVASCLSVVLVYPLSSQLVKFLFQRGSLTEDSASLITSVQQVYLFSIIPFTCGLLYSRALVALGATSFIAFAAAVNLIAKIALNKLLVPYYGVVGLAYSTVGMYFIALMTLAFGYYFYINKERKK